MERENKDIHVMFVFDMQVFLIPYSKVIKPFYEAKQRTKGFPSACMIMKINFPNASVLLSPEQNETIRTVHCLLSDQPSLLFHIHQLYKLSKV